ncbi:MAG: lysophospholipid acyltransferase family protein [Vicinamibacterales bacterium]
MSASIKALLIPAGTFLLRFLPRKAAIALSYIVADLCLLLFTARRQAIDQNLARTAPSSGRSERRQLRRATFRHFAGIWVDFLRVPLLTRQAILDLVGWNTRRNLDAALEQGKGTVIVAAHVGALDLAGIYLAARGYPISVVVEDIAPPLYRVWRRYRASTGMRVLSRRHGAVAAYRALRRGEIVAVVADRLIDGPRLEVDFCGDRRVVPLGPAAIAGRTGAPVVFLQITRRDDASGYDLVTTPAMAPTGTTEEVTRSIAAELARIVRRFPEQWFVFEAGWLGAGRDVVSVDPSVARS